MAAREALRGGGEIWFMCAGIAGIGAAGYGNQYTNKLRKELGNDCFERFYSHQSVALPAILQYKVCEFQCEKLPAMLPRLFPKPSDDEYAARLQVLHEKWAPLVFSKFMELGGFYYKTGQKMAANQGGFSPPHYVDLFQPFLNAIPARSMRDVKHVIEDDFGAKLDTVFASFDADPVGCASIGQAHRATLRRSGERVIVKVQNPEAERTFRGDVLSLKMLVDAFMPQIAPAFDEIQKQFATEFDYRGEAANSVEIRGNLLREGFRNVVVPRVHVDLCTRRVLVMEEIYPSVPLHTALDRQAELMAKRKGVSKAEFVEACAVEVRESTAAAAKRGDRAAQRSVSSTRYAFYIRLAKLKAAAYRAPLHVYDATLGPWRGRYSAAAEAAPINAARLVDDLFAVHGHQILIDGCFNADPHPGNILHLEDKIALIDYGQVKRLTDDERLRLATMYYLCAHALRGDPRALPGADAAAHARAKACVSRHMRETLGVETKRGDDDVLYDMCCVYFGRSDAAWLHPRNLLQFSDACEASDPLVSIAKCEFVIMTHSTSLLLRGLAEILQQPRSLGDVWGPLARRTLREAGRLDAVDAEIAAWTQRPSAP
ncbi:ABC1 family-domain-containing protein [Pelagophyceae sp. CCMP2097]|nr:ABC1 family-domain-containing protein [Pelagophyceae sp. CCMP2097]|mmetsp:Transcript_4700/g.16797  ORF Transcript_4700/g.16797 Transcript_4700/m.16797 type:complete len:600 (-) Transcript_4700:28-1827(-)